MRKLAALNSGTVPNANNTSQFELSSNSGEKKIEALFREIVELCFVSLLNTTQLAFVWDHNFLYGWRER